MWHRLLSTQAARATMIGCLVHINISLKAIILKNMEEKHGAGLYVVLHS